MSNTTEFVVPMWGPRAAIPSTASAWWGARAIRQEDDSVSLVADRQADGGAYQALYRFFTGDRLADLCQQIQAWAAATPDDATLTGRLAYRIQFLCRASGDYYYIAVWVESEYNPNAAWSGAHKGYVTPPQPGEAVVASVNGIGPAFVLGGLVVEGYQGILVLPTEPPEWYVRQNGRGTPTTVFGAELESILPPKREYVPFNARSGGNRSAGAKTDHPEVYVVAKGDRGFALLNRGYNLIGLGTEAEVRDLLAKSQITSVWPDYALPRELGPYPAETPLHAVWIEALDGMVSLAIEGDLPRVQIWSPTADGSWEHEMTCGLDELDEDDDPMVRVAINRLIAKVDTEVVIGGGAAPLTRLTLEA